MAVMQKMNIATGESNEISLLDANGGVLRELIEREFEMVMKNIMDVNTDTKSKRSITVKFTFAPSSDRSYMATSVGVTSKLAAVSPVEFGLTIGGTDSNPVVMETTTEIPGQTSFDGEETEEPKVINFKAATM